MNKDGSVCKVAPLNSIDVELEYEAERIIRLSAKWIPRLEDGIAVKVIHIVPVVFQSIHK